MHQIEALVKVGVTEIVLAIAYKPDAMKAEMEKQMEQSGLQDVKITYSHEKEPLGTAGPLALAREHLLADGNETFFVLNADVICEYPFAELLKYHKEKGAEGTIMVTKVDDPSKYGVVVSNENGQIQRFVEKPQIFVGDRINAGLYILQKEVLDRIELKPTSIEREVFPVMAEEGKLFAMDLPGYWMDVGQPKDYLRGLCLYMSAVKPETLRRPSGENADQITILQGVDVHPTAKIGAGSVIGPNVSIGANAVIGEGVRIQRSSIMSGTKIGSFSFIENSIIGWDSKIGKWCRLQNNTILGENVVVSSGCFINGATVCLHKGIKEDLPKEGTIVL